MQQFLTYTDRSCPIRLAELPHAEYTAFFETMQTYLASGLRCAHYFATPDHGGAYTIYAVLLDDETHSVRIGTATAVAAAPIPSLTAIYPAMHPFERAIAETTTIRYADLPWDKPLRLPYDRTDRSQNPFNYPFYSIEGEALHEVHVGPIHAGIIEPGSFRFICNGERVLHLEIALGFQHRGIEHLMTATDTRLRQAMLAEAIAGDSSVSHGRTFAATIDALAGIQTSHRLAIERTIALEMERVAMHLADTGALCGDIGYQLGQVACEALRTITINTTQRWCGNRFGKGLVRPGGSYFPITAATVESIRTQMSDVKRRYLEIVNNLHATPSVLARFEDCGHLEMIQAEAIGAVGPAARASGLLRDLRSTHPFEAYADLAHEPVTETTGDVMARLNIRCREVPQSIDHIMTLLERVTETKPSEKPVFTQALAPASLAIGLTEGWRGEICHVAITDSDGRLAVYRIKDPSLHNWLGLALAVRGEGISDFPICNKSFNLSYCGHDL